MAVLDRNRILTLIERGELIFSPLLTLDQVGSVSIDLRIGNLALVVRASGLSHVDPAQYKKRKNNDDHAIEQSRMQKFERHEFMFEQRLLLHPGALTLVPTLEWVKLPLFIKGVVTARSSWAREGLQIATANFIDPGYSGIITLELANLGQIPIALYAGLRIAQISFYEVSARVPRKASQFNLSFEPRMGDISAGDEAFIPDPKQ
jgi:dCTP deaminase